MHAGIYIKNLAVRYLLRSPCFLYVRFPEGPHIPRRLMEPCTSTSSDIVADVYNEIGRRFVSGDSRMDRVLDRVFSVPGKGTRPLFMDMVARRNGGSWETVRESAMIVEAVHVASLLHDDVVDGSLVRRGASTVNARYSNKVSVLLGDYLFLKAVMLAQTAGHPDIVGVIHKAVQRMISGEIRDSLDPVPADEAAYLTTIGDKTASLFAAAGEIGIILTGGGPRERAGGRNLGEAVGMAFQIIDDVLDWHGDSSRMGKPTFVDFREGCATLPVIHALRGLDPDEAGRMMNRGEAPEGGLIERVRARGGIEYARERAKWYIGEGRDALGFFGNNGTDEEFERFFDMIIDRDA